MHTLICGSLAYDTIMVFPDQFKKHILPEQIHILNVAFLVPEMRREFGGWARNIAYNPKLHPGVMSFSENNHGGDAADVTLGIVSPDGREGMLQHAREFHEADIPWIFDPGQGMPMFNA